MLNWNRCSLIQLYLRHISVDSLSLSWVVPSCQNSEAAAPLSWVTSIVDNNGSQSLSSIYKRITSETNESFCLKNQGASGWHIYSMGHVSLSIGINSHWRLSNWRQWCYNLSIFQIWAVPAGYEEMAWGYKRITKGEIFRMNSVKSNFAIFERLCKGIHFSDVN